MLSSDDELPNSYITTLTRMGERLAALEATTKSEISALKTDTQTIRSNLHESMNTMQKFIVEASGDKVLMREHLEKCDRRGQRIEKIIWASFAMLVSVIGFLIKQALFHG